MSEVESIVSDTVVLLIGVGTIEEHHRDRSSVIACHRLLDEKRSSARNSSASLSLRTYVCENPLADGPNKPSNKKTSDITRRRVHLLFLSGYTGSIAVLQVHGGSACVWESETHQRHFGQRRRVPVSTSVGRLGRRGHYTPCSIRVCVVSVSAQLHCGILYRFPNCWPELLLRKHWAAQLKGPGAQALKFQIFQTATKACIDR
jgi:hypothetical protein